MKLSPKVVMWLVGATAVAGILVYQAVSDPPGKRIQDGQVVTEIISTANGSESAFFDITLREGGDALHEADHVFDSIQSEAIERATFDGATLNLEVAYDPALISADTIRQMLATAGYVALEAADAVAATLSADGTMQTLEVTAGDGLVPALMSAQPGLPLTIVFGPGMGHLQTVTIRPLGIEQSLAQGATVELPALQPGTYEFVCAEGYVDGTLIVQ